MSRLDKMVQTIKDDYTQGLYNLLIADKQKKTVLLNPNTPQKFFIERFRKSLRLIVLKSRQMGLSTITQGLFFLDTVLNPNVNTVIVSHERKSTERIFQRMKNFYEWMPMSFPPQLVPKLGEKSRYNSNELYFPSLNSRIYIGTAGSDAFGRGDTINNLHLSELSSYKSRGADELIKGLLGAVPLDGGKVVAESTPRGIGNLFYTMWADEMSVYDKVYLPWWLDPTNVINEELWMKLGAGNFLEYPNVNNVTNEEIDLLNKVHREWDMLLSFEQIAFRRYAQAQYKDKFAQEFIEDDVRCFLIAQSDVFDSESINDLLVNGDLNHLFQSDEGNGKLTIFRDPKAGKTYVIGADTSEGDVNSDYCSAKVLEVESGEEVAALHGRYIDYVYANKLAMLGKLYNNALIAVERNNHGHSVINSLVHAENYKNLYVDHNDKIGWFTTGKNKSTIITGSEGLVSAIKSGDYIVHDKELLRECLTFEYKQNSSKSGGMGAMEGCFDDRVMSSAIAWACRVPAMLEAQKKGKYVL